MSRRHHDLKCETEYFQAMESGVKAFEVRKNDRGYRIGDMINLREVVGAGKVEPPLHTGRKLPPMEIIYILHGPNFGIKDGFCVMQLKSTVFSQTHR